MSSRSRSLLLVLLTLCAGILLGLLLGGRIAGKRFDTLREMVQPERVKQMMQRSLGPDAELNPELDSLLDAHARESARILHEHRMLMEARMDSLLLSLRPHLSPEQYQRLQRRLSAPPPPPVGRFRGEGPPPRVRRGQGRMRRQPPPGAGE